MQKKVVIVVMFVLGMFSVNAQPFKMYINQVNVSNQGPGAVNDGFGKTPDMVEIFNNTGSPEPMGNYYLSNDRANLYKWRFPTTFSLAPGSYTTVMCSGRDLRVLPDPLGYYHTNFDLEQCKNQWLLLVRNNGVIVDSMFIRKTKIGDTWGRYPDGTPGWWLLNSNATMGNPGTPNVGILAASVYSLGYAPAPTFSTPAGFVCNGNIDMWIADTVNFQINYTLSDCTNQDGTIPCIALDPLLTCIGPPATLKYQDPILTPIPCGITTMVRAITFPKPSNTSYTQTGTPAFYTYSTNIAQLYLPSFVETNTYFQGADQNVNPGFGVISIASPTAGFPTAASQTIHVEYFDKNMQFAEGYAKQYGLNNDPGTNEQRGYNIGLDDETGFGCAITGQVFNDATLGVSTRTVFTDFSIKAAGVDCFTQRTPTVATPTVTGAHMRDAFAQTYAMANGLNLDGLHYKPVKAFINGCYWGASEFREMVDPNYLNYYYKQHVDSVDILEEFGGPFIAAGSDTSWMNTAPPVATNTVGVFNEIRYLPMVNNAFYDIIKKRLDIKSFMDFMIYNSFLVNADLMGRNNAWWRGYTPSALTAQKNGGDTARYARTYSKWRYFMWDMNNVLNLGLPPKTLAVTNMSVSPCVYTQSLTAPSTQTTIPASYTGHGFMLSRLLQNPIFKNDYINRYMDLLNTTLRCDKMIAHYNYFKTMFTPEMNLHYTFPTPWVGLVIGDWDSPNNMDTLLHAIQNRCVNTASLLAKASCLNFTGPYTINIDVKPQGAGSVDYNSLHLTNFIWTGNYYQNKIAPYLLTYLNAEPFDSTVYVFDHWEFTNPTNSTTATPHVIIRQDELAPDSISLVLTASDNITAVFVDKRNDIVMPTGFTPNGDGWNDVLAPLGQQARFARDYEFQVWNRWGQEIFRTGDSAAGWDGRYNGAEAQTGVYAYLIKYKNTANEVKYIKGNVTLIR